MTDIQAARDRPARGGGEPEAAGIRFRRAGVADRDPLARLHHDCSRLQPGGFMHRLGVPFFRSYYRILLPDPNTLILAAEDAEGRILGFVAGCLDARCEVARLRRHRARLLLACLGPLVRRPGLAMDLLARLRYLDGAQPGSWSEEGGPRISFWCWDPASPGARQSTALLRGYLECLRESGARVVRFEVDRINRKVEITHRLMGARTVRTLRTPEGRERLVMEHVLG